MNALKGGPGGARLGSRSASPADATPRATLALVLAAVLWGLAWLPLKAIAAGGLSGLALTLVAAAAAGLAVLPAAWRGRRASRAAGRPLLAIAVLGGYANLSFALALVHGEVVRVMVLFYLLPVWAAVGGRLFLGERLTLARAGAVTLAVPGVLLTLGGPAALAAPPAGADLLALSSGIAFALNNLVFRAHPGVPLAGKVAAMQLGSAAMAATALAVGPEATTSPPLVTVAGALAYGLGWLLLATLGTQWGVTHLPAARASVIITLELVTAAVSATWLGAESWSVLKGAGVALILAATALQGLAEGGGSARGDDRRKATPRTG